MEFSPRAAELTTLLESRMTNFYTHFQVDEIGRVVFSSYEGSLPGRSEKLEWAPPLLHLDKTLML